MPDFNSLLHSGCFTFLVGPEKQAFEVHSAAISRLSKPLTALIHGKMREAETKTAILDDIEPQTFALFAEYAYTGMLRLPAKPSTAMDEPINDNLNALKTFFCTRCARMSLKDETANPCCRETLCRAAYEKTGCVSCLVCTRPTKDPTIKICSNKKCLRLATGPSEVHRQSKAWTQFQKTEYGTADKTHKQTADYLRTLDPKGEASDHLPSHAKLWVFADRYLVDELKPLCLHKLHRDLVAFDINQQSIGRVVDLLTYTYEHTSDGRDAAGGPGCKLRALVTGFAAAKAEKMGEHDGFNDMLAAGGDLVVDLMQLLAKRVK